MVADVTAATAGTVSAHADDASHAATDGDAQWQFCGRREARGATKLSNVTIVHPRSPSPNGKGGGSLYHHHIRILDPRPF